MEDTAPAGHRSHPTDLPDTEWAALEPLLPPPARLGRPLKWPRRTMAEVIFYLVRSGCAWRLLPRRSVSQTVPPRCHTLRERADNCLALPA